MFTGTILPEGPRTTELEIAEVNVIISAALCRLAVARYKKAKYHFIVRNKDCEIIGPLYVVNSFAGFIETC